MLISQAFKSMENPDNTQLGTDDWNVNSDLNGRKLIFARSSLGSDVPMELDEIENDLRRQTKDSVTTDDFEKWRNSDILSSHADGLKEGSFKENKDPNVQEISINDMNVSTQSLSCTVDNRVIDISTTNSDIQEVIESLEAKKEPTYSSLESKIPSNSSDVHSKSESEILSIHHQSKSSKDFQKSEQVSQGPSFSDQIFETPFLKCKPSHDDDSLLEQIIPLEVRIENATDRTLNENDANTSCHDSIQNQVIGSTPIPFSPTNQIKTSTITNQLENDPTSQRPIKQSTIKYEHDSKPSLEITAGYSKEITNNDLLKKGTSNSTIITTKQNILPGKRELPDVALKLNDPKSTLLPVTPKYCEDFKIPEEEISTAQPSCKYPKTQEIRTECSSSPPSSASLTTPKSSKSDIPINTELIDSKKSARNLPSSQDLKRKVAPIATKTYSTATEDALYSELKAIKIASITARITAIQADIASKRTRIEEINKELKAPAAETVKRHIKLLHEYNDIRDVGQGLIGMIADQRGVRIGDLYDEFGVGLKD